MLQLVLLTGGLATRLNELTKSKPKALVEINRKPFIYHQLKLVKSQGIEEVILCVGHFGEMIKDYVGNGSRWGLTIQYSFDGKKQLGTAGAIKNTLDILEENFFVLYGDSYLDIDYKTVENYYYLNEKKPVMVVIKNNNNWDTSNVSLKKNMLVEYNKSAPKKNMRYVDYGISILDKSIFLNTPKNKFSDLSNIYYDLSKSNDLLGYEVFNRFYEIGTIQGIKETENYLSSKG